MRQVDIRRLLTAADVVGLARLTLVDEQVDRPAVVVDVQPIADVEAVAVQRQRLPIDRIGDEQRNDLLGELV